MMTSLRLAALLSALLNPLNVSTNIQPSYSTEYSQPIIFSSLEGIHWVKQCAIQYPEVLWLANAAVRHTEEGHATLQGTYSEQLFGQKFMEFDRTMMTIRCLKLILDGSEESYQAFTAAQPENSKLSRSSFETLHLQGKRLLESGWYGLSESQLAQTMETALILGDMGKSEKARELFKPYGVVAPDQDDFYGEAMRVLERDSSLSPSFAKLPASAQMLLAKVANMAHYGHVTHLEGGLEMFSRLKQSAVPFTDPCAASLDLFIHTCDVAGALGHVNNQSSVVYTELTHRAMQAMGDAVQVLGNPDKNEWDAYNAYLTVRASWLGLNPEDSGDRVLTRVGAMLRLFTTEEGAILRRVMDELPEEMQDRIKAQLNVQAHQQIGRTPTYMPAVLVNLSNNPQLGSTKEERLAKTLELGLPFITKVLEKYHRLLAIGEFDATIPLNFNKMAGVAKTDPSSLEGDFYIDHDGIINLLMD